MMIILNSTNAYLGAWVTAGIAVGGIIFSGIQSIYKKQILDEQVEAYSQLITYLPKSDVGFNSKIWDIQESLSKD